MNTAPPANARAFSLAELAIAIGIIAFVLLGLAGMVGASLTASRSAQEDTLQAAAARTLLTKLKATDFDAAKSSTNWFNYDGTTNATSVGAYLECTTTVSIPSGLRSEAAPNFKMVRLQFVYPLKAATNVRSTNILHASLVR